MQDNRDLAHVNIAHNQIDSLHALRGKPLTMLNASYNEIRVINADLVESWSKTLHTLVLSKNQLKRLPKLANKMPLLELLVISDNEIEDLQGVMRFSQLKKLSASHNQIRTLPVQDMQELKALRELRLAHNKIMSLPDTLATCSSLEVCYCIQVLLTL